MKNKKIIAVFGGSFNPPLVSHITLAEEILKNMTKVEKVIFVPVGTKYSKPGLIENKHRYNMLKLACKYNDRLEVSRVEIDAKSQPFTIDTLEMIKKENPGYEIYLIIGSDNLKQLEKWHTPDEILKNFRVIVLKRNNDQVEDIINQSNFLSKYQDRIVNLENIKKIRLSSTSVRKRIKEGKTIEKQVSKEVNEYIKRNKLYI